MVNYRSTALAQTAPELVSAVESNDMSRVPSIRAANQAAERVREEFKKKSHAKRSSASNKDNAPLDEEGKAGRYDRRLKMNRESAAASRVRREAYIKALEHQLVLEEEKFKTLRTELDAERTAHSKLRTDVETARLLAVAPVTNDEQPALPEPPVMEVKMEDFVSDLTSHTQLPTDQDEFTALLLGSNGTVEHPPPPDVEQYASTVTDLFTDLGLPFTQVPPHLLSDTDPQNIDRIMDLENE